MIGPIHTSTALPRKYNRNGGKTLCKRQIYSSADRWRNRSNVGTKGTIGHAKPRYQVGTLEKRQMEYESLFCRAPVGSATRRF